MNLNKIDSETEINPLAAEIKIDSKNTAQQEKRALLLIHGFGGKSSNWLFAAEKINQQLKIPIYIPRLPGHGTNISDFLNSSAKQWLRKAVDSYLELSRKYEEVYLAGLSMGGVLAALIAADFPAAKLSLVAPAFYTSNKNIIFTPYLKYFVKKIGTGFDFDFAELTAAEKDYHQNYSLNYYTKNLAELYKIMKKGRKAADSISVPTQLILSTNDKQVDSKKIKKFLNQKMGRFLVDQKTYQKSSHIIINDLEKERCAEDLINFFKN